MSVPAAFDYYPATSVDEAISLLQQYGDDAKLLAGGHSLLPTMKLRLAQPGVLIDIGRISSLSYIREDNGVVAVGALTTYATMARSDVLRNHFALLSDAASVLGDPQVRNRGTLGGAVSHADPAADMTAIVMALKADIVVKGPNGERSIKADDFFVDLLTTALEPGEILREIRITKPQGRTGHAYVKMHHPASGFAVVGVAANLLRDVDSGCQMASVGITGVSSKAYRAAAVESGLTGQTLDEKTIGDAAARATEGIDVNGDLFASEDFRRHLAQVFAKRAITTAASRAR